MLYVNVTSQFHVSTEVPTKVVTLPLCIPAHWRFAKGSGGSHVCAVNAPANVDIPMATTYLENDGINSSKKRFEIDDCSVDTAGLLDNHTPPPAT